jgi:hypothetical protein
LEYIRQTQDGSATVVVAINMSARAKTLALDSERMGIRSTPVRRIASTDASLQLGTNSESVILPSFSSWVGEVREGSDDSNR